jgi:hypothetical protein
LLLKLYVQYGYIINKKKNIKYCYLYTKQMLDIWLEPVHLRQSKHPDVEPVHLRQSTHPCVEPVHLRQSTHPYVEPVHLRQSKHPKWVIRTRNWTNRQYNSQKTKEQTTLSCYFNCHMQQEDLRWMGLEYFSLQRANNNLQGELLFPRPQTIF